MHIFVHLIQNYFMLLKHLDTILNGVLELITAISYILLPNKLIYVDVGGDVDVWDTRIIWKLVA